MDNREKAASELVVQCIQHTKSKLRLELFFFGQQNSSLKMRLPEYCPLNFEIELLIIEEYDWAQYLVLKKKPQLVETPDIVSQVVVG